MLYDFDDLKNSSDPAERELSAQILTIYKALDNTLFRLKRNTKHC